MNEALERLIRMQEIYTAREETVERLAMIPERIDVLQQQLEEFRTNQAALSERIASIHEKIQSFQSDVDRLKEKRTEYESQLLEVETSEAYRALLKNIEDVEEKMRKIEKQILEHMVAEEEVRKEIETQKQKEPEVKRQIGEEQKGLEKEEQEIQIRHNELKAQWDEESEALDGKNLDIFMRLLKSNNGTAVVRIKSVCGACAKPIRSQYVEKARQDGKVLQCENCGCFLVRAVDLIPKR